MKAQASTALSLDREPPPSDSKKQRSDHLYALREGVGRLRRDQWSRACRKAWSRAAPIAARASSAASRSPSTVRASVSS